jgi:predicted Rossmann-fold nucleotide-binding protein
VLVGTSYWQGLVDWLRSSALAEGKINAVDLDLLLLTDDVDEIVRHIRKSAKHRSPQEDAEQASARQTKHDAE